MLDLYRQNETYKFMAGSPLQTATDPRWCDVVLGDLDRFLVDHAACERKAAVQCLSLISKYPEYPHLVDPLISLGREEMDHFRDVHRLIRKRGTEIGPDERDPYVSHLSKGMRKGGPYGLLDRLIVSALIEARGNERFMLLSEALALRTNEIELSVFYRKLAKAEAGHYKVFLTLAHGLYDGTDGQGEVEAALQRLAACEAEAVNSAPLRPTVH